MTHPSVKPGGCLCRRRSRFTVLPLARKRVLPPRRHRQLVYCRWQTLAAANDDAAATLNGIRNPLWIIAIGTACFFRDGCGRHDMSCSGPQRGPRSRLSMPAVVGRIENSQAAHRRSDHAAVAIEMRARVAEDFAQDLPAQAATQRSPRCTTAPFRCPTACLWEK